MSYDIYFIKKKKLNSENVYSILESTDINITDEHFISKDLIWKLKSTLEEKGLKFEVFESKTEDFIQLNFPTYQVSMFNSQLSISIPYWDSNSDDGINKEIKTITNVFLENGFIGFDPQTEQFIKKKYEFQRTFTATKSVIDEHLDINNNNLTNKISGKYIGIVLGIILIGIIIWKIIEK